MMTKLYMKQGNTYIILAQFFYKLHTYCTWKFYSFYQNVHGKKTAFQNLSYFVWEVGRMVDTLMF